MTCRLAIAPLLITLILATASGCASKNENIQSITDPNVQTAAAAPQASPAEFSLDDYDDEPTLVAYDPFETWNRFWFGFNDFILLKVVKPVHQGYSFIVPEKMRSGIDNFTDNIAAPVRLVNSLLQGEFGQAGVEFSRFFINTITSFGFADVASTNKPRFEYHPESATFGGTLAAWGLPEGAYFVWPFLGPSTARGTLGMAGDSFLRPESYFLSFGQNMSFHGGLMFNSSDDMYMPYEKATQAALDPYVFIRNTYLTFLRKMYR